MVEMVGLAGQAARAAHNTDSAKLAKTLRDAALSGYRRMRQIKLYVTGNERIEQTVVVVVSLGWSGGPAAESDASFFGDICERPIVIVVVQPVLAVIRDIDVRPAVVVVIAHCNAKSPAEIGDAGFFGDIGESAVV